ncbi:MAG: TolC family protein [Isosphaerales bacterium]
MDQAVDRFLKENLELRAMRDEIPMAQADVEAAGQPPQGYLLIKVGTNGIKTWHIQPRELILNRWIQTLVARAARRVIEAQYQDAIRTRVDNLYTAFVNVQEAQMSVRFAEVALRGVESLLRVAQSLQKAAQVSNVDVASTKTECELGASSLEEAKTALHKAKLVLANLLNLPDAEVDRLKVRMDLDSPTVRSPAVPPVEELIRIALTHRPDLRAYRLGLHRAQLDWLKALVEPFNQITVRPLPDRMELVGMRQPGNAPARSLSMLVSLPTAIRNRGALDRATINVGQTRTELAQIERNVILEVRQARLEYEQSRATVDRFLKEIIPNARTTRDNRYRQWRAGEASITDYVEFQSKYNDRIFQYVNARIRHQRSMLALNTAVGERIMR